ncbi:MAG: acyltransferase family protein, partial [Alphaproteobacteria bacterium]
MNSTENHSRVAWVDVAKGICIVMVVMMHSTLGVGAATGAEGWLHTVVEFARPFRMPDFFLIAGLFLASRIDAPWRLYLDRKVLHFAYFYALWLTIQFAFKAPGFAAELGWDGALALYLKSFIEPFGTLWFIYHLALFFLVTRMFKSVPWPLVWLAAALLQIAPIHTGSILIDEFASRFVFFYSGYIFARHIFAIADWVDRHALVGLAGLAGWGLLNGVLVFSGIGDWPVLNLALGYAGVGGIIAASILLAKSAATRPVETVLSWLGARSIVVYLAFFLPMAISRAVLLKLGVISDIGTISALVTLAGITGP